MMLQLQILFVAWSRLIWTKASLSLWYPWQFEIVLSVSPLVCSFFVNCIFHYGMIKKSFANLHHIQQSLLIHFMRNAKHLQIAFTYGKYATPHYIAYIVLMHHLVHASMKTQQQNTVQY